MENNGARTGKKVFFIMMAVIVAFSFFVGAVVSPPKFGADYSQNNESIDQAYELALSDAAKYFTDIEINEDSFEVDETYDNNLTNVVEGYGYLDEYGYTTIYVDLDEEKVYYSAYDLSDLVCYAIAEKMELPENVSGYSYDNRVSFNLPYIRNEYEKGKLVDSEVSSFYSAFPGSYFDKEYDEIADEILSGDAPFKFSIDINNYDTDADGIYELFQTYPCLERFSCENFNGTDDYDYCITADYRGYVDEDGTISISTENYANVESDGIIVSYTQEEVSRDYTDGIITYDQTNNYITPEIQLDDDTLTITTADDCYYYIYTRNPDIFSRHPYYYYYDSKEKLDLVEIPDLELYYLAEEDSTYEELFYQSVEISL